ncbi:MAG: protein translocase subunit SecD [Phycisphaerales bacterium]
MRHLVRNSFIVLVVAVLAVLAIVPPEDKLRRGKDLAGGTSLIYQVNIKPGDPADTLSNMIELLKRRVDPKGMMEIQMVAQGTNRIEITMPLGGDRVKAFRAEFETEIAQLASGALSVDQFDRVMAMPPEQRATEIAALGGGDAAQVALLNTAAAAYDAAVRARAQFQASRSGFEKPIEEFGKALEEARSRGEPEEVIKAITASVEAAQDALAAGALEPARAEKAFEQAREAAKATAISTAEVRRVLDLPAVARKYKDTQTGETKQIPSPRQRALARLREAHPGAVEKLDRVVAKYDTFQANRSTLDDPQDLIRLLRGAGVLDFRIGVKPGEALDEARLRQELREKGPRNVRSTEHRWFKLNKEDTWFDSLEEQQAMMAAPPSYFGGRYNAVVEEFDGQYFMLLYDVKGKRLTQAEGAWRCESARQSQDELGRPCISFSMDVLGADKMSQLTGSNVRNMMAVLLDDEVYTAPNINSKIGKQGQIAGNFSQAEIGYVVRVLNAGSLAAKLSPEPISVSTVGPELGVDNLRRGLLAGAISFVAVTAFMVFYYFTCGAVSIVAMVLNALIILAAMALNRAPFSLPAIAGVILTFGMAVDANVLIYERMREELSFGQDLRNAVRLGYQKALSSIVDGHVTILIVCVILGFTGTQEIKGFAIAMSIGAVATLFTQLFFTRLLFTVMVEKLRWKKLSMLPIAVPAVQRLFSFNIDWMKYRFVFIGFSLVISLACLATLAVRGSGVLDNEFLGGTKITLRFKDGADGQPLTLKRAEVEERVQTLAEEAATSTDAARRQLEQLREADIITVNPQADGVTSSTFQIKSVITNADLVQGALAQAFRDRLDVLEALSFRGLETVNDRDLPVRPIVTSRLADAIDRADRPMDVSAYLGGAAIILENLSPPTPVKSLQQRIDATLSKAEFADSIARKHLVVLLDGTAEAATGVVVLVHDDSISYLNDEQTWRSQLKMPEWRLVVGALATAGTPASVDKFDPSIAATFTAQAVIAVLLSSIGIVIYIWVRFNSIRYSMAAIATSLHDCLVAVGLLAMAEVFVDFAPNAATSLGILPFKIDLNVIAATLTILGYSLNDTIVVMDRIREKRGKLPYASRAVINRAINDTLSRTILTGGTTLAASVVLYTVGGEAVRAFAFTFIVGVLVGTYSSIAIAAPIVWVRKADPTVDDTGRAASAGEPGILPAARANGSPRLEGRPA